MFRLQAALGFLLPPQKKLMCCFCKLLLIPIYINTAISCLFQKINKLDCQNTPHCMTKMLCFTQASQLQLVFFCISFSCFLFSLPFCPRFPSSKFQQIKLVEILLLNKKNHFLVCNCSRQTGCSLRMEYGAFQIQVTCAALTPVNSDGVFFHT